MEHYVQFTAFALFFCCSAARNNVLLIIFDDLRPALGCYGDRNAVTPNIDRIAQDGFIFQRAYAQQAVCAPSRNSFLTSRRPDTIRLYDFYSYWRTFSGNFTTIPQYFKENGYHTKSVGKVFHPGISSNFSDDQPYSWSEEPFHPSTEVYKNAEVCYSDDDPFVARKNVVCPVRPESQPGGTLPDIESTQEAIEFLKTTSASKSPFFLAVGFHKPHLPLKYPHHFDGYHDLDDVVLPQHRTRPASMPDVAWNPWTDMRERHDIAKLGLDFPYGRVPDNKAKHILRSYYASVTYVDSLLGQIINELKASGKYEDTVIALLGDHGWSLGEHGEWSKFSNYDVATRVPLIFRAPSTITNMAGSEVRTDPVELLDLFPTLVNLAGLPDIPRCGLRSKETQLCTEGRTIFDRSEANEAFSQYPRPSVAPQENSDKPKLADIRIMGYSIVTDRFHYTEWIGFRNFTPQWSELVARELYDTRRTKMKRRTWWTPRSIAMT
uniref:Iduronate 2-sulfatase n=1 Tax=Lygus hesperus TaxID=30085 RepID=A0A0A9XN97_LYGHE